jgi:hypothetical protein
MKLRSYLRRPIALPQEHGSWIFLLSPLSIGFFAGGSFSLASFYLLITAFAGFLIRQPVTILVKAMSGRRTKRDIPAAIFWISFYSIVGSSAFAGLVVKGYGYLLLLVIPGLPVFAWHLYLISKRAERGQIGIEVVASGVLALSAPAAYWVGTGHPDPEGWWLWILTWIQSSASIVYAYLRLKQRTWVEIPGIVERLKAGRRAILYTTFNVGFAGILSAAKVAPLLIILPYVVQWLETLWGSIFQPAVGFKPNRIGFRQLGISSIFTILFILTWL